MAHNRLPTIADLARLFSALKPEIHDDYRAFEEDDDSNTPSMQVTIGWTPESGAWDYQTGDNSYSGGAYLHPHWAVVALYRRSNVRDLAREVQDQLDALTW